MPFTQPLDIYNRALQHIGRIRVAAITEASQQALEITNSYDSLRRAELQRNLWRFATRRARLRPIGPLTKVYTPSAWAIGTAYTVGQVVSYVGYYWFLNVATSTGDQPDTSPKWQHYFGPITLDLFDALDTQGYDVGELAIGSDAKIYLSLVNANTLDPTTAPAGNWATLAGTTAAVVLMWPAGTGPVTDRLTKNVFRLPWGFLREAPQNPKGGVQVWLGTTTGDARNDWTFEGDFFVTSEIRPILFRFGADVWDVAAMTPMFCEMLSARIATEVAPSLVEGKELGQAVQGAERHYNREAAEARLRNLIELGPVFPPLDGYISCRF